MDWMLMSKFKKALFCFALLVAGSISCSAMADTGYYLFVQNRYFGHKLDTETYGHSLDESPVCAAKFYPSAAKHLFSYLKNTSRTINESIAYGDWDKPYRVIGGFEYDYKRNKASKSAYGYRDRSGSLFILADRALSGNYVRLGGGAVLTRYDSSYDGDMYQDDENFYAVLYLIYNDAARQIRWRSRASAGFGSSGVRRRAGSQNIEKSFKDDFHNYFYGWENALSRTFQKGVYYVQPQAELNILGLRRGKITEPEIAGRGIQIPENQQTLIESIWTLYAGVKGTDSFSGKYDFKVGPALTFIHSDPYDAFYGIGYYDDNAVYFKARRDERDYITWKAVAKYTFPNGFGIYGDFRYYQKDKDSVAWLMGINYRF